MSTNESKNTFRMPSLASVRPGDQVAGNDFPLVSSIHLTDPVGHRSFSKSRELTLDTGFLEPSSSVGELTYVDQGLEIGAEETIQIGVSKTVTTGRSLVYWIQQGEQMLKIAKVYDGNCVLSRTYQAGGDATHAELASIEAGTTNVTFHNAGTNSVVIRAVAIYDREFGSSPFAE